MVVTGAKVKEFFVAQFRRDSNPFRGLFLVEYASWIYGLITCILVVILGKNMNHPYDMIESRFMLVGGTALLLWLYKIYPCRFTGFLRILLQFMMLIFWYPETYEFNRLFENKDHLFANLEQTLFGCQPAIEFSKWLSSKFWSEAFNLGYWSYYLMIVGVVFYQYLFNPKKIQRICFVILTSFFLYYFVYIFLPVAGPQFYYLAVGYPDKEIYDIAQNGFPAIGDYFYHHTDILPAPGDADGFFFKRVADAQAAGERPTAAFPSSHVGISTILMIIAWGTRKKLLFFVLLPFYVLLCCATVYIQAHYLIDAIAGFITSFGAFYISNTLFHCLTDKALPWRRKGSF